MTNRLIIQNSIILLNVQNVFKYVFLYFVVLKISLRVILYFR